MTFNILVDFYAGDVLLMPSLKILFVVIIRTHDKEKTYFS